MAGFFWSKRDDRKVELAPLLKILECSVCLEVVKIPFKECNRGHLICSECMKSLHPKCPTCQAAVFQENPVRVKNLLEALLRPCRYKNRGCGRFVAPDGDHVTFCGFRRVGCLVGQCGETLLASRLQQHMRDCHEEVDFHDSSNGPMTIRRFQPTGSLVVYLASMLERLETWVTPIYALDTLFCLTLTVDRIEGHLVLSFKAVFIEKPVLDYFIDLKFDRNHAGFVYSLRASGGAAALNGEDDGSTAKVLKSSLKPFTDSDGDLMFTYTVYSKQTNHSSCDN